ncbi:MAG: hypothetical protein FWE70_05090, partial [Oscillospiraceae bacterium]|nr:hypothetical protein [Oscillospiraceae bacterium]
MATVVQKDKESKAARRRALLALACVYFVIALIFSQFKLKGFLTIMLVEWLITLIVILVLINVLSRYLSKGERPERDARNAPPAAQRTQPGHAAAKGAGFGSAGAPMADGWAKGAREHRIGQGMDARPAGPPSSAGHTGRPAERSPAEPMIITLPKDGGIGARQDRGAG